MNTKIDITYDFRRDTPEGKDPDSYSKTLRQYHKLLWSKPLPSGEQFLLSDDTPGHYLHHKSALGEFSLSSDSVIPTFRWHDVVQSMIPKIELDAFNAQGYTIGGIMVFPEIESTESGLLTRLVVVPEVLGDRFDLTLECIRRHYIDGISPLANTLARYSDFFKLFGSFRGYVEFFFLQDLVSDDFSAVKLSRPYNDFNGSPVPGSISEYREYEDDAIAFIRARNQRILTAA